MNIERIDTDVAELMWDNQLLIEQIIIDKPKELVLYCEKCKTPYSIIWMTRSTNSVFYIPSYIKEMYPYLGSTPYCGNCRTLTSPGPIVAIDFPIHHWGDRLNELCALMLWSTTRRNEKTFDVYLDDAYEYIFGETWHKDEVWMDEPINWFGHDYNCCNYRKYYGEEDLTPEEILEEIVNQVKKLVEKKDEMIHVINRRDLDKYTSNVFSFLRVVDHNIKAHNSFNLSPQ